MENKIYLITIMKYSVSVITVIVGYTTNSSKSNIDSYLKEKYKIILGEELEDCSILEDNHWVYSTNKSNVFVHIESLLEIK